jgi:hypothetical protein
MSDQKVYTRRIILLCPVDQARTVEEALALATGVSWTGSLTDPHHEGGPTGAPASLSGTAPCARLLPRRAGVGAPAGGPW